MARAYPNKADRFTFHDLRAKAGSDSDDTRLLGHADLRTLNRHYRRKPETVQPVEIATPYSGDLHVTTDESD